MKQTTLLLNTAESRQLKKEGVLTVKRGNIVLSLEWDKEQKIAIIKGSKASDTLEVVIREESKIFLTGEQSKELCEKGQIFITYHECDYNVVMDNGHATATPVNHFTNVYVR